ncbi:MAG TPA: ABC transporter ATP-binding protein/permease [Gammaproteobacteria bacterium]|nr:ABC transporter ATP-binding protein/permease [Gammaproteobacteria bacterium]
MRPHSENLDENHTRNDLKTIRSLFPYLWQFRGRVLLALGFLILAKVSSVGVPLILKEIVDALDASQNPVLILPVALILAYGLVRILAVVFGELRDAIFAKVTQNTIRRIALKVFRHLHSLSLSFHLDRQTGGVSRDIERGSRGISFLLNFMVFNILPTVVEISLIAGILLLYYNIWYALIPFATAVVYIAFTLVITEWRMKFRRKMNEMDSRANTRAIDSLLNYETVKYFGNEDFEARRYDENLQVWEQAAIKNQTSLSALNVGQGSIIAVGITAMLMLAAQGVTAGELTLGDLVLINTYLMQMFIPMNFLGFVYREIKHSLADMERMFKLLEENREISDKPGAKDLQVSRGEVRFEHVSFSYKAQRRILEDVSFAVPPGHKVAVVGPSGSGKSTLVRLLFRFYDVDEGRIAIDGVDIRDVTQQSLRAAIGIVPQDTVLFNDTIYYNISYARPDASREEVLHAARLAHLDAFIESLPEGYDTVVGERGLKVSGGEKQRIAIARAILKNPRILVFDEATSALDSESEQAILAALREVAENHTTLVIAHRLSTIVDADRILVLKKGRIVESGTHHDLLAAGNVYARMWALQQEEKHRTPRLEEP